MLRFRTGLVGLLFFAGTACLNGQVSQALLHKAKALNFNGKYDSAVSLIRNMSFDLGDSGNLQLAAKIYYELGEGLLNVGKCDSSKLVIQKGIDLSSANDTLLAMGYYQLAKSVGGCSNSRKEAIDILRKSLAIREPLFGKGSLEISYDYTLMGYLLVYSGEYDSAQHYLEKALEIRNKVKGIDPVEMSVTYYYLGKVLERKGSLKEALDYIQQSLRIREKHLPVFHPSTSNCLNDIGNIYNKYGNYERALDYSLRSLEIRKATLGPDHINVAASYYSIGTLYGNMFNYHRAIYFIEQGNLILSKKYGEQMPVLHTYYAYLGRLYHKVGNDERARFFLIKSKELGERYLPKNHHYLAIIYNILGQYYADKDSLVEQQNYHTKALMIFEEVSPNTGSHAEVMVSLGESFGKTSHYNMAVGHYEQALDIYHDRFGRKNPKIATLYRLYGDLERRQGNVDLALQMYWSSLNAVAYEEVKPGPLVKVDFFSHNLMALRSIHRVASAHRSLSQESKEIDDLALSLSYYKNAIELIDVIAKGYQQEDSRAQLAKDTKLVIDGAVESAYEMAELTGEAQYVQTLYDFIEKSKSPVLLSQIQAREARNFSLVPDSIIRIERDLRIELTYNRTKLRSAEEAKDSIAAFHHKNEVFDLQNSYDQFKENIKTNFPEYYEFRYTNTVLPVQDLQDRLPAETIILNYYESNDAIFIIGVENDRLSKSKQALSPELISAIEGYEKSLSDNVYIVESPDEADSLYVNTASYLFKSLVLPVVSSGKENLLIVPGGRLTRLSFGTFLVDKPSNRSFKYAHLDYVLSRFSVSYAHSSTVNFVPRGRHFVRRFAGFAPSYEALEYAEIDSLKHPMTYELVRSGTLPLPGAIAEVEEINELLEGEIWLKEKASETNFKEHAGEYGIIHLAMHSLLNSQDPVSSELLFNSENDSLNDGFLTIDEIYNLDLNAVMAVLSACSSGGGKVEVGEGPISFSRAFSYAGCPSVITSMWKLPDAATHEIMVAFYENIKSGMSKDKALRQAQLGYLNATEDPLYQHPFFWGSFIVMGDSGPVKLTGNQSRYYTLIFLAVLTLLCLYLLFRKRMLVT